MNKDEMVKEVANLIYSCQFADDCTGGHCDECLATALINLGYRKVGKSEIVVKKSKIGMLEKTIDYLEMEKAQLYKQREQAEQETARKILRLIYNRIKYKESANPPEIRIVKYAAKKYGIELGEEK